MKNDALTATEEKFAELLWANVPINSTLLVNLCEKELGWKKSTTYTMLKKLCAKGLFQNQNALVQALQTKEEYHQQQGVRLVEEQFGGSLPRFLTAFFGDRPLTPKQAEEIRALIDAHIEPR